LGYSQNQTKDKDLENAFIWEVNPGNTHQGVEKERKKSNTAFVSEEVTKVGSIPLGTSELSYFREKEMGSLTITLNIAPGCYCPGVLLPQVLSSFVWAGAKHMS
jgi:hypothetical protein